MKRNLTKKEILRIRSDIRSVFKEGSIVRRSNITVIIQENAREFSRVLAVVKRSRNAVSRNSGRRRIKEAFQRLKPMFCSSFDIIVIIAEQVPPFARIFSVLRNALSRNGVILQE